jgi:glutamate racemase
MIGAEDPAWHRGKGPIGVFDSGVGGLTVLREIRRLLPHEDLLYVADSRYAPYGDKPAAEIQARSLAVAEFLQGRGAKAIVVACNTATAAAAQLLRGRFDLPVIAMEPAVKPAAEQTRSGVVGVLATSQTLASHRFLQLVGRFRQGVEVLVQPCPGLVEQIEAGQLASEATRALLADLMAPLLQRGVDTLVLGCTHYPLLTPLIRDLAGPGVTITDSGSAVARQLHRRLSEAGLLAEGTEPGAERFWTSADPAAPAAELIQRLWGARATVELMSELAHAGEEIALPA